MSIQFNPNAGAKPNPIEKEWWEETSDEELITEMDVEFVRLQIERVLKQPCQIDVAKLLASTGTSNPFDSEAFKKQLISNYQQSK